MSKENMAKASKKVTPLMEQYYQIKSKYKETILFFRVGDFYETFGEDAITTSKILGITLTKKGAGTAGETELAGFPFHALDTYMPKMVKAGYRCAICDQLEDPKKTKTLVKRGITEIVTPGVALNDKILDYKSNNFLCAVHFDKKSNGVAFLDISTGEFLVAEGPLAYIDKLLQSLKPREIVYFKKKKKELIEYFGSSFYTYPLEDWIFQETYAKEILQHHFKTNSLQGFGVEEYSAGKIAAGAALHYIRENQLKDIDHVQKIIRIEPDDAVWLDKFTIKNLELLFSNNENGKGLLEVLDATQSPMGSRLLKKWIILPLKEKEQIDQRLDIVEALKDSNIQENLIQQIKEIGDLERLIAKVPMGKINPREVNQLSRGIKAIKEVRKYLQSTEATVLKDLASKFTSLDELVEKIDSQIQSDPPIHTDKGNVIKEGICSELDNWRDIQSNGKGQLDAIQERESNLTGIPSLKIGFNNVFGYYLEVRNTHKDKVPESWIRKQTLVSAERYITQELKEHEEKILNADAAIKSIEGNLFSKLVIDLMNFIPKIQTNSVHIAHLDVLLNFAQLAERFRYNKPEITNDYDLDIKQGRHPVIEQQLELLEDYIPNDVYLNNSEQQIIIITGPNMAGKSALLRQTALITLMAQIGSFVPADFAKIGIVDKIFTRVGASDNISSGESTFMVEMNETASILNNLSDRSLVLLDEIGRGTSTYDGVSLAWSITEFIHEHKTKAKTLFATHYHELNELECKFDRIANFNVSVKEYQGKIIFLRKLQKGGTAHSFGLHVAQLAGMPNPVLVRAAEVLKHLESLRESGENNADLSQIPESAKQMNLFATEDPKMKHLRQSIETMDINNMSPIDALLQLAELKQTIA